CYLPCRRRFFLPKHSGNRVAQQLDHYEGPTSVPATRSPPSGARQLIRKWNLVAELFVSGLMSRGRGQLGLLIRKGAGRYVTLSTIALMFFMRSTRRRSEKCGPRDTPNFWLFSGTQEAMA
ncbi:hypothetical protein, partial [Williamsia limnetica]|uniref:hypothetical protein n=1 Tax=Williamsia limnetica TaxID=882452 RepID=UPI001B86F210